MLSFRAKRHFNLAQKVPVPGTQSITQAWKKSLIMWYIRPFPFAGTLQRQSDISIVHRALWTELMGDFIDCVCCNLSIQTCPAVAGCRVCSIGSSAAICSSKHTHCIHIFLPQPLPKGYIATNESWNWFNWKYERKRGKDRNQVTTYQLSDTVALKAILRFKPNSSWPLKVTVYSI